MSWLWPAFLWTLGYLLVSAAFGFAAMVHVYADELRDRKEHPLRYLYNDHPPVPEWKEFPKGVVWPLVLIVIAVMWLVGVIRNVGDKAVSRAGQFVFDAQNVKENSDER